MKRIIPPNPIDDWLNKTYYASDYLYFDNWTFVHFSAGILIAYLLIKKWHLPNPFLKAFGIIVLYEVFEYYLGGLFFNPETKTDILWDLIVGMTGFTAAWMLLHQKRKAEDQPLDEPLITEE